MTNKGSQVAESRIPSRKSANDTLRDPPSVADVVGESLFAVISPRKRSRPGAVQELGKEAGKRLYVSFEEDAACSFNGDPPMKRRRFQRRNSKTAKMLFSSIASFDTSDCGERESRTMGPAACAQFDENIEIAEDLVRQLNFYRKGITTK
eukprot:scaffold1319_cov126-Cylindrotheca_fusiformis.AAC.9